jgi:tRNA A-37 threonylcarbamoyl transferase component Bud32
MKFNGGDVANLFKPKIKISVPEATLPVNNIIGVLKGLVTTKNAAESNAVAVPQSTRSSSKPIIKGDPQTGITKNMGTAYQAYITKAIKEANKEIEAENAKVKKVKVNVTCPADVAEEKEEFNVSGRFAESLDYLIIGKQVGQGAYATVRVAFDKKLNCKIALKIYDKAKLIEPQRQKSVQREIKIMEKLSHQNIVKLYTAFDTRRHVVVTMEYVKGMSLHGYLKSRPNRRLEEYEAKKIFKQVVNGVEYCHGKNIAHRDIKPENILLDERYHLKLADFGTAKILSEKRVSHEEDPLGPTSKGSTFVGTAEYVSPEVLLDKESGPASDLWALGCLLYQFFAGRAPFKGKTEFLTFNLIIEGKVSYPYVFYLIIHNRTFLLPLGSCVKVC